MTCHHYPKLYLFYSLCAGVQSISFSRCQPHLGKHKLCVKAQQKVEVARLRAFKAVEITGLPTSYITLKSVVIKCYAVTGNRTSFTAINGFCTNLERLRKTFTKHGLRFTKAQTTHLCTQLTRQEQC